jgi:hypothetical protein
MKLSTIVFFSAQHLIVLKKGCFLQDQINEILYMENHKNSQTLAISLYGMEPKGKGPHAAGLITKQPENMNK